MLCKGYRPTYPSLLVGATTQSRQRSWRSISILDSAGEGQAPDSGFQSTLTTSSAHGPREGFEEWDLH